MAQNQDGVADVVLTKFHGLCHGTDTEETAFVLQQPGDLHGAVAVGVGLDDSHDGNPGLGGDGVDVCPDGVQINCDIGVVGV
ncbi:MAG: hypothetical protein IIW93_01595, partial [Bacteroidaceae bacterium]|nr:hypothetical protein [Bacteroidaceae bacterium]